MPAFRDLWKSLRAPNRRVSLSAARTTRGRNTCHHAPQDQEHSAGTGPRGTDGRFGPRRLVGGKRRRTATCPSTAGRTCPTASRSTIRRRSADPAVVRLPRPAGGRADNARRRTAGETVTETGPVVSRSPLFLDVEGFLDSYAAGRRSGPGRIGRQPVTPSARRRDRCRPGRRPKSRERAHEGRNGLCSVSCALAP
jgi:hypothetical protein